MNPAWIYSSLYHPVEKLFCNLLNGGRTRKGKEPKKAPPFLTSQRPGPPRLGALPLVFPNSDTVWQQQAVAAVSRELPIPALWEGMTPSGLEASGSRSTPGRRPSGASCFSGVWGLSCRLSSNGAAFTRTPASPAMPGCTPVTCWGTPATAPLSRRG